ncbi:MAG: hypothetical protein AAFY57_03860 [Cyanobacteria bacterium J06642_2]
MITLILALVAATVTTRSLNRGQQATGERARQATNNEVRESLDRARAKLDYMFNPAVQADNRLPQGRPGTDFLVSLFLDGTAVNGTTAPAPVTGTSLSFQLPDENDLTLNAAIPAPAWWYDVDTDGDGSIDSVTGYAIIANTRNAAGTLAIEDGLTDQVKADNLIVRGISLQGAAQPINCPAAVGSGLPVDAQGSWFLTPDGRFVKPMQVVAVTLPKADSAGETRSTSAVQLQQDRYRAGLGEFGAYFRADLEIFPGPTFNWNGKVYSESNIIIGDNTDRFVAYLISDPDSCYYNPASRSTFSSPFELINGSMKTNNFNGGSQFHLQDGSNNPPVIDLRASNDSVDGAPDPNALAINPGLLYTQATRQPNYVVAGGTLGAYRDSAWDGSDLATGGTSGEPRVELLGATDRRPRPPYVDDTFRADNRCGPNPNYGFETLPSGCTNNGDTVASTEDNVIREAAIGGDPSTVGLDGYWERRARNEGTRIIVGQRLSLLKGHFDNPSLPTIVDVDNNGLETAEIDNAFPDDLSTRGSIAVDLDDNDTLDILEQAVQATAVYHFTSADLDVPIACLSTLADFNNSPVPNSNEFVPPPTTAFANFGTPMMQALANLARFSSDGDDRDDTTSSGATVAFDFGTIGDGVTDPVAGAYPPFQEPAASNKTHPNPQLIRHGDFSNLRQALELMDGGTSFNNLSIADKSYLYTSACALGMLAASPSINYDFDGTDNILGTLDDLDGLGKDGILGNTDDGLPVLSGANGSQRREAINKFLVSKITTLNAGLDGILGNSDDPIVAGEDGALGTGDDLIQFNFAGTDDTIGTSDDSIPVGPSLAPYNFDWNDQAAGVLFNNGATITSNSQFDSARSSVNDNLLGIDFKKHPLGDNQMRNAYFKGPDGNWNSGDEPTMAEAFGYNLTDPTLGDTPFMRALILGALWGEDKSSGNGNERFDDSVGPTLLGNDGRIGTVGADGIAGTADDIASDQVDDIIRFDGPDGIFGTADDPSALRTLFNNVNPALVALANNGNTTLANSLVDTNIYNGRERLVVRTLDLDLNALRTLGQGGDFIFPRSGIMYGVREDAVREDSIARPVGATIANGIPTSTPDLNAANPGSGDNCNTNQRPGGNTSCIYTQPYEGNDPQLSAINTTLVQAAMGGISTKPVDYYADPLRRPYAFRLSNGAQLGRTGDNNRGLSFISDNPVYIAGNFNLHSSFEFTNNRGVEDGNFNVSEFYGRDGLNSDFAAGGTADDWRPSEILSDAISIIDGFDDTLRPSDNASMNLPGVEGRYGFQNVDISGGNTTVNAIMVSAIVPSRGGQSFGGLHNFPRFIQTWGSRNLIIAGSFIQLNYSTQATAPFDQDSWARDNNATPNANAGSEPIAYYGPPRRRWGYDVGVQYAPISPVAARFDIPTNDRDEFVRDLSADDPYARVLRCALQNDPSADVAIDPSLTCP